MYRDTTNKMLGGVCAGAAKQFGLNVTLIRIAAIASMVLPGPQILIYLILWFLIPEEGKPARF